ncbi:hypothetical protein HPP92_007648 [Vanilla planifolia]|uniref:Timeless N-terminal domain-containing protein n=1 Tax=Vanilla planifolia TaxID=51239 RepID=A0A835RMU6_VANPL|nr:hypothetical protein HPP92_007648 [Vanilla planifolia]
MGRKVNTDGLCIICSGLGLADEDDNGNIQGYTKTDYCLDNLKDLQRFLRRDDPQRRDVFKQICRWKTVSRDLVPIIEHCQHDRNLVINAVKILVFLTMAVDPASDDVAQQIEYLWDVKAALTRKVTIAVIVSLLEEPLGHLERQALGTFTEDDWKLVQLILTLFRNILSIQGITVQQKASGSATRFLHLTEKLLEIMFHENAVDLILVLVQHVNDPGGYIRQINLLLLEVLHYILLGWDPELVANTFINNTKDGSKMLIKGNPAAASATGLSKVRKVPRGPLKKVALDNGGSFLRQDNIRELLHTFLNQFLSGGYNEIESENDLSNFILQKLSSDGMINDSINCQPLECVSLNHDLCGPIASTMNEAMYALVISKWREVFEGVKMTNEYKFLNAAASLLKSMIRMLDLVLKRLPEDSKECETARVMLYKLFYDQTDKGLTQFLLNLFRCFNSHKQPKSDLADLLEIIHIILRLMEKLQAYGALRVSKKLRRRTKKKASKNQNEVDSRMINKSDNAHQLSSSTSEPCLDLGKSKPENILDSNPGQSKQELHQDGVLLVSPPVESDVLENTQHVQNHSSPSHVDEENKNYADHEYETGGSSNNEPTTNEDEKSAFAICGNTLLKTRRECEHINAEALMGDIVKTKLRKSKRSSMADISENKIDDDVSEITPTSAQVQETSRRHNHPSFTQEQIAIISELYHNNTRKRVRAFSVEEELEITVLYEKRQKEASCGECVAVQILAHNSSKKHL